MGKLFKNTNGITLIALIVTIIVLIILAGISINLLLGDNGIMIKARLAAFTHELETIAEQVELEKGDVSIEEALTGNLRAIFTNRYVINDDTPSTLITQINEVRTKKEKTETFDENDEKVYYIPAKLAGVDGVYVYDLLTGTVFKIPQTKIGNQIYHYVRPGLTELAQGSPTTNPDPDPDPPGPPEQIDPDPDPDPNYPKYIPIYSIQDFKKVASGELQYEIRGTKYDMIPGAIYQLMNDIDFGGETLTPLPVFTGIFYGQNYTLKNFKIDNSSATTTLKYYSNDVDTNTTTGRNVGNVTTIEAPTGLFSRVTGGIALTGNYAGNIGGLIHKLKIDNVEEITGRGSVAILIGDGTSVRIRDVQINQNSNTITQITATGVRTSSEETSYSNIAGVIGYLYNDGNSVSEFKNIKVKNIKTIASVPTAATGMTAIVSTLYGKASFESCFIEDSQDLTSGIVNYARNSISLYNCWATNVEYKAVNTRQSVGGLVGHLNTTEMLTLDKGNKAGVNIYNCGIKDSEIVTAMDGAGIIAVALAPVNFEKITVENTKINTTYSSSGVVCIIKPATRASVLFDTISANNNIIVNSEARASGILGYIENVSNIDVNKMNYDGNIVYGKDVVASIVRCGINMNKISISNSDIKNSSIVGVSNTTVGGLIGYLESPYDSSIKENIIISNTNVTDLIVCGGQAIGGIVGYSTSAFKISSSKIDNIQLSAPRNEDETFKDIPGLDGIKYANYTSTITAGGIVGSIYYYADDFSVIENTEISNIKFDKISSGSYPTALIGGISGIFKGKTKLNNIDIHDISMKDLSGHMGGLFYYYTGNTLELSGKVSNINIEPIAAENAAGLIAISIDSSTYTIKENAQISDIEIKGDVQDAGGLFSFVSGATINVENGAKIENINVKSERIAAGIGRHMSKFNTNGATIKNITVESKKDNFIGGITTYCYGVNIQNSNISNITVNAPNRQSHALPSGLVSMGKVDITNSQINKIKVNAAVTINNNVSGIVSNGNCTIKSSNISEIEVEAAASTTNFGSSNGNIGGLISFGKIDISEDTVIDDITVKGEGVVGGLVAVLEGDSNIQNSEIKNITVENKNTLSRGILLTGGVAGYSKGGMYGGTGGLIKEATFENIDVLGDGIVGGLIGFGGIKIDDIDVEGVAVKNIETGVTSSFIPLSFSTGGIFGFIYDPTIIYIKNIDANDVQLTNGIAVGGITGNIYSTFRPGLEFTGFSLKDVTITAETGKKIYAAGGVVGHGGNSKSFTYGEDTYNAITLSNATVDNLSISNAEFAGGIAGIALPTISGCEVKNSSISAVASNTGYLLPVSYTGGYAGGIIGAGGKLTANTLALTFTNNKVKATTISGGTASGDFYGAGTYYADDYDGERLTDSLSGNTKEN